MHCFPTIDFLPLFLNEDGRNLKNGLSKLHCRFRRHSTLLKTVLLEFQYLQGYDDLLHYFFWPKKIRKTVLTLQILRFKQACPSLSHREKVCRKIDCWEN